jgi:hypothetical protein
MATTVISAFNELHSRQGLTRAQQETASTRVGSLRGFFSSHFEMREPVFAVGSYDRKTICDRERDIDLMAPFEPYGEQKYWDRYKQDSRDFLYWVRKRLNDRYHSTRVSSRQLCVKLDFTQIETDVTPCLPRKGGGFLMPDGKGGWMATNPPYHTQFMDDANRDHDWDLKPLVRLLKWWNIANGHHLRSFHLELMVERIQRGSTIGSHPAEVAYTLKRLPALVQKPFSDPWPDGNRVDDYLSADARDKVVGMLENDAKRAQEAEVYRDAGKSKAAFERWEVIYRHTFPAYG